MGMTWNDLMNSLKRRRKIVVVDEDCVYPDCRYTNKEATKPRVPKHNPAIPTATQDVPAVKQPIPKANPKPRKRT